MRRFLIKIAIFGLILSAVFLFSADKIIGIVSPPKVITAFSQPKLTINFDKPVNRQELKPSIFPDIPGEWKFENPLAKNHLFRTLVFEPAIAFAQDTNYQVKLENIKGFAVAKPSLFYFDFKTEAIKERAPSSETAKSESITLIDTPFYWQEHKLSCEAASLRMALASKGVYVSEEEIMEKIGYDPTRRQGVIWGDPYNAFVGDIDGKIGVTGYGVYWDPVAKAANNWAEAEAFSNWNLDGLIKELLAGNPAVIWGKLPVETTTDISWITPEGKFIKAIKEDHVRVAIGFIGSPENPSKIIINDPLSGKLFWDTSYFLENWSVFENSAVVVRAKI